jgi:RimJ/RimL family protein N-acetyltransferase
MTAPEPAIVIRPATEAELTAVVDLLAEVAAEDRWIATEVPFDRAKRAATMAERLRGPEAASFVAVSGGAIVGHIGMTVRRPGLLELGMMVAAGRRGQGIGGALLSAALAWARGTPAYKITLEVFPDNTAARALYRKFGFVEEGLFRRHVRRRNGELRDTIPMSVWLDDAPPAAT